MTTQPRIEHKHSFSGLPGHHHPSIPITNLRYPPAATTLRYSPPLPFDTHQPPPPNPETSTSARFQGYHCFPVTTTLRNPPATTPNPETSNECTFLSPPPFNTYQPPPPNPETSASLVFGVVTFLWSPPPPSALKMSNECSFSSPPPFDTYQTPSPNPETSVTRKPLSV